MRFLRVTALILAGCLVLAGCKKKEEAPPAPAPEASSTAPAPSTTPETTPAASTDITVTSIDLGKAVGPDLKVSQPATTFAPTDTIYVAVSTTGKKPQANVEAKWTYGDKGKLVKQDKVMFLPTGTDTTDLSIQNPKGWPEGKYKVEISIDGAAAGSKDFEVKK